MEKFWEDDDFESKLKEGILSKKRFKILYRILLFASGTLFFLVGWLTWNIPLESEDGTHNSLFVKMNEIVGYDLGWPLFLSGLFMQFIIAPWFVFSSISNTGRLSLLVPKEIREYLALKSEIKGKNARKEIENLYWEALNDPSHRYHKEIIRYKWMDKIRWKHRPEDFFGHAKYTKETGGVTLGPVVPKTSDAYRNSNVTFDENDNVNGIANPAIHPLRRIISFTLIIFLITSTELVNRFMIGLISLDFSSFIATSPFIFPVAYWTGRRYIKQNTDLLANLEKKPEELSVEAIEERLNILRDKYVSIREHEEEQKAIETRNLRRDEVAKSNLSNTTAIIIMVSIATLSVGLDSNPLDFTLTFGFSFLAISLLVAKHFRLAQFALSFKGYRLTQDYLYLLDGICSKKLKRNDIPEHSCIRIVDLYPTNTVKYHRGPNVCLHLIRLLREEPHVFARMGQQMIKPGYMLNGYERTFFDGLGPRNEGVECWVEDIKIRFEFKTKAEQREFAEKLANELSLPIREHWRWSDDKKSNLFWLGSDFKSIKKKLK